MNRLGAIAGVSLALVVGPACTGTASTGPRPPSRNTTLTANRLMPTTSIVVAIPPQSYPGQRRPFELPPPKNGVITVDLPDKDLHFEPGSAVLSPGDEAQLRTLAAQIVAARPERVLVEGFCDSTGGPSYPQDQLSQDRANRVRDFIVGAGVDFEVKPIGWGTRKPLPPPAKDQDNRRVLITIVPRNR